MLLLATLIGAVHRTFDRALFVAGAFRIGVAVDDLNDTGLI